MSQVHISSPTHTVTVNHDSADLSYLIDKAQKLWEDTKPPDGGAPGPAYGFSMEREQRRDGYVRHMGDEGGQPTVK